MLSFSKSKKLKKRLRNSKNDGGYLPLAKLFYLITLVSLVTLITTVALDTPITLITIITLVSG